MQDIIDQLKNIASGNHWAMNGDKTNRVAGLIAEALERLTRDDKKDAALRHARLTLELVLADEWVQEAGAFKGKMIPRAIQAIDEALEEK